MSKERKAPWTEGVLKAEGRKVIATGHTDTFSGTVRGTIAWFEDTDQADGEGRNWGTSGTPEGNALLFAHSRELVALLEEVVFNWDNVDIDWQHQHTELIEEKIRPLLSRLYGEEA